MLTEHTLCYIKFLEIKIYLKKIKLRLKIPIINICIRNQDTNKERERERKLIIIFERKVYRRILGPVYDKEKRKLVNINL